METCKCGQKLSLCIDKMNSGLVNGREYNDVVVDSVYEWKVGQ